VAVGHHSLLVCCCFFWQLLWHTWVLVFTEQCCDVFVW